MDRPKKQCFICDKVVVFYCKNIQTLRTNHTETLVYKFIEKFMGDRFHMEEMINEHQILCQDCVMKLDEYDLATQTALKVEREMAVLLMRKFGGENNQLDLGGDTDLIEEIQVERIQMEEKKVFIKCNHCGMMFTNMVELQMHTHQKTPKKAIKREKDENIYEDVVYVDHVDFDEDEGDEEVDYSLIDGLDVQLGESSSENIKFDSGSVVVKKEKVAKSKSSKPKSPKTTAAKGPLKCEICGKEFLAKTELRVRNCDIIFGLKLLFKQRSFLFINYFI